MALDGSRKHLSFYTRNSTGAILYLCENDPQDDSWDDSEWNPYIARMMILPEKMGFEPTDNDTGEILAMSLADEMLPPAIPAIYISDSTTSTGVYRSLRDGTITSNRALVRKILSGCGKGCVGRLLRNLAHHSIKAQHLASYSAALHHHMYNSRGPFDFQYSREKPQYEYLGDDNGLGHDNETAGDLQSLLQWHYLNSNRVAPNEATHNDTLPINLGPVSNLAQQLKMTRAQRNMRTWVSYDTDKPFKEEYYDGHPHRPVIKVKSHQLDENSQCNQRHSKEATPNITIARMNHGVDTMIERDFLLLNRGRQCISPIPPNVPFDPHGMRYVLFVKGHAITKNVSKAILQMEDDERRHKSAQRDWQGLLARVENDVDLTAIEVGWSGGATQMMRAMGACHLRSQRQSKTYAYRHALHIEGYDTDPAKTETERKAFMCDERTEDLYQQCPFCSAKDIETHQSNIDEFHAYLDCVKNDGNIGNVQHPTSYDHYHPNRATPWHAHVCMLPSMRKAREIANTHIEEKLTQAFHIADKAMREAYIPTSNSTPKLRDLLLRNLRAAELLPHLTSAGISGKYHRCTTVTRPQNETILTQEEWTRQFASHRNCATITNSIQNWPNAIECGIIKPETVPQIPSYRQCALDTCGMGWTPLVFKKTFKEWLHVMKDATDNKKVIDQVKSDLMKQYSRLRLAIYLKANLLQKVTRAELTHRIDYLNRLYNIDEEMDDDLLSVATEPDNLDIDDEGPPPAIDLFDNQESSDMDISDDDADEMQVDEPPIPPNIETTTQKAAAANIECTQIRCLR